MLEMFLVFILGLFVGMCWMFILTMPHETAPIMMGQEWTIEGLGRVTILKVASSGGTLPGDGKGFDVLYQMKDGRAGYCKKMDVWKAGKLMRSPDISSQTTEKDVPKSNTEQKSPRNPHVPNYSEDFIDVDYWSETAVANRSKIDKTYC